MNAGRILRRAGYDNDCLRSTIAPVDPDEIDVLPASSLMRRLWRKGIQGVTVRRWIFVDPEVMRGDPQRLGRLVIHELVHVRQYVEHGYLPFTARYAYQYGLGLLEGKGSRRAYLDVAAEREARAETSRILGAM
ncbi:MAG: hypothetical protein WAL25_14495 [Acidimicrobiia bacterium]